MSASLPNYGILALPNLETKIVAANTLLGLKRGQLLLGSDSVRKLERELQQVRHDYFTARSYAEKKALKKQDQELCAQLSEALVFSGELSAADSRRVTGWNPYSATAAAPFFDAGWMFGLPAPEGDGVFDLLIGNPPYVRQEELKNVLVQDSHGKDSPLKDVLKGQYECYTGTADLYVYFFERSFQLLRTGGVLSFITSNKYFRAAYGARLRTYLLYATQPRVLLDFGDSPVFTAVAYPCIVVTQKTRHLNRGDLPEPEEFKLPDRIEQLIDSPDRTFPALIWSSGTPLREFPFVFEQQSIALAQRNLKPDGWRLEGHVGLRLIDRLFKAPSLDDYCSKRLFWGIKTGLNEAFVIDRKTRDDLIAADASSEKILKPFLRGRDVKKWGVQSQDLWIIFTRRGCDIQKYPAIHDHLKPFKKQLMPGISGGRKPGNYEWFELQDNVAFWKEFEHPKIIIPAITDSVNFAPDRQGFYCNNKASICVPPSVPFALGVLNSSVSAWLTGKICASKESGFWDFEPRYSRQFRIPPATPEQQRWCERLSEALIWLHRPGAGEKAAGAPVSLMTAWFEQWLNGLVYELFFAEELHARHLHLFAETAKPENAPPDLAQLQESEKLPRLQQLFERTSAANHPLRALLTDLRSLEPIRLIEGEPPAGNKIMEHTTR